MFSIVAIASLLLQSAAVNTDKDETSTPVCGICLEEFENEDATLLDTCEHKFHSHCIDVWLVQNLAKGAEASCPTCRNVIFEAQEGGAREEEEDGEQADTELHAAIEAIYRQDLRERRAERRANRARRERPALAPQTHWTQILPAQTASSSSSAQPALAPHVLPAQTASSPSSTQPALAPQTRWTYVLPAQTASSSSSTQSALAPQDSLNTSFAPPARLPSITWAPQGWSGEVRNLGQEQASYVVFQHPAQEAPQPALAPQDSLNTSFVPPARLLSMTWAPQAWSGEVRDLWQGQASYVVLQHPAQEAPQHAEVHTEA